MSPARSEEPGTMNHIDSRSARQARLFFTGIVLALFCWSLSPGVTQAATGTPSWQVTVRSVPTVMEPGMRFGAEPSPGQEFGGEAAPGYQITAVNNGTGPTNGEYTIVDTLPLGVTLNEETEKRHVVVGGHEGLATCEPFVIGTPTVREVISCNGKAQIAPGGELEVRFPVAVSRAAVEPASNLVEVQGGEAALSSVVTPLRLSSEEPVFGFLPGSEGFGGEFTSVAGGEMTQAGGTPFRQGLAFAFPILPVRDFKETGFAPEGGAKEVEINLPKGIAINPTAAATCTEAQLEAFPESSCPPGSMVGNVRVDLGLFAIPNQFGSPIYNMQPQPGVPAILAFEVESGAYVHLLGRVRSDGDFGLSARVTGLTNKNGVLGSRAELWGIPSASQHDSLRFPCNGLVSESCPAEFTGKSFVTMPTSCEGPLTTSALVNSWFNPAAFHEGSASTAGMEGCDRLEFDPSITSQATTDHADSPSGLEFHLHVPQAPPAAEPEAEPPLQTANVKNVSVTLPPGMTLNPASANGLEVCSSTQVGLTTPVGQAQPIHFDESPSSCPNSAKLGNVQISTPLLENPLGGVVYLAKPFDNPFKSLLAIYLVIEDPQTGIVAKLAGKVEPSSSDGQLTTVFTENPELPIEDINLSLFKDSNAPLTTPLTCGEKTTTTDLTPWTTPEGADAHPSDSFVTSAPASSGACPATEAEAPKAFSFTAGTVSPLAGSFSPFVLHLSRKDGEQHITGIETTLPEGLIGKLAGVTYCPQSGIEQAQKREQAEQGKLEQQNPSCPASSEVGTVAITAGSGISPIPVSGHAYMAGPYKGAPFSLVVIVPAVAGPFDLGTVVDRVALNVGEYDARIRAVADPLPTIRDGIPFDVRSIELKLDRPGFMLNPTSCDAKQIEGSVSTQAGQSAAVKNRFQVGECGRLAFKPKLALSLKGQTKRTGHPALTATVTYPKGGGYANIAGVQVSLPHSEFLDQGNIGKACTKPVLQAGACPAKSVYGTVKAWTPLLDNPLEGNVYLVGGFGYKLPALVAELNGQLKVLLVGKIDTGKNKGIRNTFEVVPDAPVEKFVLQMKGGKKYGLLENSENICKKTQKANATFTAQNGKVLGLSPVIANSCGGKKGSGKKKKH